MSANVLFRNGLIAAVGISGLTLSACANSHANPYDVYAFESGSSNCGAAPAPASTRYGSACHFESAPAVAMAPVYADCGAAPAMVQPGCAPAAPVYHAPEPAPVYADCGQIAAMDCGGQVPMHTQPAPFVGSSTHSSGSSMGMSSMGSAADCPAGTSMQSDGTCLQGGGSSYGSSSSYSTGMGIASLPNSSPPTMSTSMSSSASISCPTGTTLQSDNTCLQSGSSSTYTGSSYSSSSSSSSAPVSCPSGTVMQGDGTCMTTSSNSGYSSSSSYTATDYLPIRK